jgi:hypothetical protein
MLLSLRVEAEGFDQLHDFAQVVAGLELVFELAEDLTDLVLDGVGAVRPLFETLQLGEELLVNEVAEVISDEGAVVVKAAAGGKRRSPP